MGRRPPCWPGDALRRLHAPAACTACLQGSACSCGALARTARCLAARVQARLCIASRARPPAAADARPPARVRMLRPRHQHTRPSAEGWGVMQG